MKGFIEKLKVLINKISIKRIVIWCFFGLNIFITLSSLVILKPFNDRFIQIKHNFILQDSIDVIQLTYTDSLKNSKMDNLQALLCNGWDSTARNLEEYFSLLKNNGLDVKYQYNTPENFEVGGIKVNKFPILFTVYNKGKHIDDLIQILYQANHSFNDFIIFNSISMSGSGEGVQLMNISAVVWVKQ